MIQFRMQQIKVDQFAILADQLPEKEINIETNLGVGANAKSQSVCIKLKNSFLSEGKILLTLEISCIFMISPDSWAANTSNSQTTISRKDLAHLAMHTFGTARGILFCKTEGTPYQAIILPPTNVDKIITNDLTIQG